MRAKNQFTLCFLLVHSAFCISARAQGTAFTYQGRLNDSGVAAAGIYDFRFTLYDRLFGGSAVGWPVTNSPTAVSNGLFVVTLDFDTNFPGAPRWLEIEVRTNGGGAFTTLSPRQQITRTPYAIQSTYAALASGVSGGVSAAQLYGTISSNNIAAGSITTTMLATGSVGANQLAAGAVTTAALAENAVTGSKIAMIGAVTGQITFTNPTPSNFDRFGSAIAPFGTDRILIGAPYATDLNVNHGDAYLFSASGSLLTTFSNLSLNHYFGISVAAVGSDRVLIGKPGESTLAYQSGVAHLFTTNGALLVTFTNPTPADSDWFGSSVAAVGNDRVLISAYRDDTGATDTGAAYLFSTNGTLLTTFTNPAAAFDGRFGLSVAAVGNDRVLIGAIANDFGALNAGAAYLFSTNGTLLTTFTNPAPAAADLFGNAVAVVGNDRILIGAYADDAGATDAGSAYLFSTNGALLATFTNPTPANGDNFGYSVAAVGNDYVLIGARWDDTGATNAGAAYLFRTNGVLNMTLTNPAPANGDQFGYAVAVVGNGGLLVGANEDSAGATNTGAAYLFNFEAYAPGLIAEGVRAGGINAAMLAGNAVTGAALADGAVSSNELAFGAVTADALADGAVGSTALASGAVTTAALANGSVTADKVATVSNWFALTIPNPTPASGDAFGRTVAAFGSERVLVGDPWDDTGAGNAGAAYLFSANGDLLTTFANPVPGLNDNFGASVAAFGSDRVMIASPFAEVAATDSGALYLFSANGILLATFANPTPGADEFGGAMAAVGTDRVLVGARLDDTGANNAGVAYLLSSNAVTRTFTNPTPFADDYFGVSVAGLGTDRVLIGAIGDASGGNLGGAAYLFSTNGTLLTTFTNPTPASGDNFGSALASVGTDRVLIGAPGDDTGAMNAGVAYLFRTNGTLLTTFTNPTPSSGEGFGASIAAGGGDLLLFGVPVESTGAPQAGAAYLFDTNGALLTTLTNPTPANTDEFGKALAAVASNRFIVGAPGDDTGGLNSGSAYLYSIEDFMEELVADAVRARSITTASLEDGAVTLAKLDSTIGVWTRSGDNVYRTVGNVGVGTNSPQAKLHVAGGDIVAGGNMGVGTTAPAYRVHVVSPESRLRLETTSGFNYAATEYATDARTWHSGTAGSGVINGLSGKYYIFDGTVNATRMVIDQSGNMGVGTLSPGATLEVRTTSGTGNAIRFGYFTGGTGNLIAGPSRVAIATEDLVERLSIRQGSGNVGLGLTDPVYRLQLATDSAGKPNGGSWANSSDARLKKNIAPITNALERLTRLRGVTFEWRNPEDHADQCGPQGGFIAQEVETEFPNWITEVDAAERDRALTQNGKVKSLTLPFEFDALIVEALRELEQKQEAKLARELKRRDAENAELRQTVKELKEIVKAMSEKLERGAKITPADP